MASVVIHRYLKTGGQGVATAKAHLRYIQHRKRDDERERPDDEQKKSKARELFDGERDSVDRREINRLIDSQHGNVAIHKLTLSPGLNGADLKEYTREVMDELGKAKGLDLQWAAAAHKNTDHDHVHVVVIGTDKNGRKVELRKADHDLLRELSDRYLEREHNYDRELSREGREADRLVKSWRNPEQEREETQERVGNLFGRGQLFEIGRGERPELSERDEPITIGLDRYGQGDSYYKTDELETLRELVRDYESGSSGYTHDLGDEQYERLKGWIEERESQLGQVPQREGLDREPGKEPELKREKPINISLGDPDSDGQVDSYYKTDDLERLKELASDYAAGGGYALCMGEQEYERLKGWIEERDRQPSQGAKREGWSKEDAIAALPEREKITVQDKVYTKYDTTESLKGLNEHIKNHYEDRLDKQQYAQMRRWMETKERDGDDCFEKWDKERYRLAEQSKENSKQRLQKAQEPRRNDQSDKPKERDKEGKQAFQVNRQWQEFNTSSRTQKTYEDRSGHIYRRMPRQQRMYEARGRDLEHHAIYMNSMAMHALRQARERTQDPKVLQYIEKELASLKAHGQELAKELPPINLDRLYGKDVDKSRGRNREPDRPLDLKNIGFPDAVEQASKPGIESMFAKPKGREKEVASANDKGDKNTDQREREDKGASKEVPADASADSTSSNEQKLQKEQEQAREAQSKLAQEQNRQMSEKAEKSVSETLEQKITKPQKEDRGGRERDER